MKRTFLLTFALFLISTLWGQINPIDLDGVFQCKYRNDGIIKLSWRPQTIQYSYVEKENPAEGITLVDAQNGKRTTLLTLADFCKGIKSTVSKIPYFAWINQNCIYFPTFNFYYFIDNKTFKAGFEIPDIYETIDENNDLSLLVVSKESSPTGVYVLAKQNDYAEILLCPDTGKNIVFGKSVHRSEWGIDEGQYISPNSNFIAFYRMDESMVEDYPLVNTTTPIATVEMMKYPMAGRTSHQVKVGIFDVQQSALQKKSVFHYIKTELADGEFLTNVTFSPDERYLYITHLNRAQNHSKLIRYDVKTGDKIDLLIEETDSRYEEPQTRMIFMKNGNFLWQSDRTGWNHFYLYNSEGILIKQVTNGDWEVMESYGLDDKNENLYFLT